jgi:hypothetical protein
MLLNNYAVSYPNLYIFVKLKIFDVYNIYPIDFFIHSSRTLCVSSSLSKLEIFILFNSKGGLYFSCHPSFFHSPIKFHFKGQCHDMVAEMSPWSSNLGLN